MTPVPRKHGTRTTLTESRCVPRRELLRNPGHWYPSVSSVYLNGVMDVYTSDRFHAELGYVH